MRSLSFKMTLATAFVLSMTLGGASWFAISTEQEFQFAQVERYTRSVADIVVQSFDTQVNEEKPFHRKYLAAKLLELPQLHNLVVVAIDGTIQFSRSRQDIGQPLNMPERSPCMQCHAVDGVNSSKRTYVSQLGESTYHMAFPIPNQPQCIRCHKAKYTNLGTLLVEMEVEPLLQNIERHRFAYMSSVLVSLFLALLGTLFFFRRMVEKPLSHMKKDMSRVEAGHFDIGPGPSSKDEIRELYESFMQMTGKLEKSQNELNNMLAKKSAKVDDLNKELRKIYSNLIKMEHLSAIGTLSAQVVHEVRTPLNALNLNLQLLSRSLNQHQDLEEEPRKLAANIGMEVERISAVLESFLDRARHPRSMPTRESIRELVLGVVALMQPEAGKAGVELKVGIPMGQDYMLVHADEVRQIIINLISNAIQSMPQGGEVNIGAQRINGNYKISVKDTGSGISEKDQVKVFSPFYTTRENGTGLGLAIVKRLVKELGGEISVESELGKGSNFIMVLPVGK